MGVLTGRPRSSTRPRLYRAALGFAAFLACFGSAPPQGAERVQEYAVKAAFLYNFVKFVDWPADAFPDPVAPLVIGVAGEDPFGAALQPVHGQTVKSRKIEVRSVRTVRELAGCQVLFVPADEERKSARLLEAARERAILTVGDSPDFARGKGIIGFFLAERRVRFEIDLEASRHARLAISSQLLKLARVVSKEGER